MSFIIRWFSKKEPEDYEQILSALKLDIQKRQTRLSEIRLRERRSTLLVTMYTLAFWTVYVTMWYTNVLPNLSGHRPNSAFQKFAKGAPALIGPIVILFTRRIVQIWYKRIGDAEEKTLVALTKQRYERIEEIKKKTGYYTTRNLLERYDDSPSSSPSPVQPRPQMQPSVPPTPVSAPVHRPTVQLTPQKKPLTASNLLSPIPQQPLPPPSKKWYDKIVDAILGDEDSSTSAVSRYALICQKCFVHNGLVKESLWMDTQYTCPKCGHFNPSPRSHGQQATESNSKPQSQLPSPNRAGGGKGSKAEQVDEANMSAGTVAMDIDVDS